jgi:hypothetical protein
MNDVLIGKRKQKSVWLDEGAIAFITTYSRQHNINFSRAIESLALLGLQDTKAVGTAWLAFNVAGGSQKTLAARRQRVMLEMTAELQERVRILTRIVLALAATELQIPPDADDTHHWNTLTEATGVATERRSMVVEQLLDAFDSTMPLSVQTRLKTIVKQQLREDPWAYLDPATDAANSIPDADGTL